MTPDSKLGARLTGTFMERLSAVVQVVSQYEADGSCRTELEWENLKYQAESRCNDPVGRTALPTFMYSDSLTVGYTLPYVRIPVEIYAQLPVSIAFDGSNPRIPCQ